MPGGDGKPGRPDALIIAADRYRDPGLGALRSPSRDAAELAGVLGDQAIGGFDVQVLLNAPGHLLREEIDGFFADRRPDHLLVLYLSCHGVMDAAGQLHFAASTTKLSRLASTGIDAHFVYEQVDRCRARKILLLLDCCYSGAYLKGHRPKAERRRAGIRSPDGRGRAVITSCTALEYAFEIDTGQVTGTAAPSVFTSALVEGLRTGNADRDGDGLVSLDELYTYVFDRVRETTPHQTPEKKWGDIRGDFIIAKNPLPPARQPHPTATAAGKADDSPKPSTTRRALLGLAVASAAGLALTGWELSHHTATPPRKPTPAPTALWTFPGDGTALQAVSGGILYLYNGTPPQLVALRASDGRQLWHSQPLGFLAATAATGIVYAWDPSRLYALHADNGREIWHSPIAYPSGLAEASGVLYVTDEYGAVYAIRASDGAKLWSFATSQGESSGVEVSGNAVYTAGANQGASVYALHAGTELWRSPISPVYTGPKVAGGIVYVATNVGILHALRASDGTEIWTVPMELDLTGAVITNDKLYIADIHGPLYALSPKNGAKFWSFPADTASRPILAGDVVYIAGERAAYALHARDGTKIWNFAADNGINAIASAADKVYVASNNLYALHASDGTRIWSFPVEADPSMMMVADGNIYLAASNGDVHALRA
jgi:outer membrane protein assembly factor BamB